jgi:hypothetical protein
MDIAPRDRLVTLPEGVPDLTLGWEAIHWLPGYDFRSDGQIYTSRLGRFLKQHNQDGYWTVALRLPSGKQVRREVSRLICEAFHGTPPGPWTEWQAAHLDHNKDNNWEWNLEWQTVQENADASVAAGLRRNQFTAGSQTGWSDDVKDRISASLVGHRASEETRARLRAARVGAVRDDYGRFAGR